MTEPTLHILDDPGAAVGALLAAQAALPGAIVLTGGSSVAGAYAHAAAAQPDWRQASVWWSDERCVPPDDERSNYGLARRTLLDALAHPPAVHRIRGELAPPEAARAYGRGARGRRARPAVARPRQATGTSPRSFPARRSCASASGS